MARQATLLVADEIYYNLHGKAILQGVYSGDLTIPIDPSPAIQLIFYFIMETDLADPFKRLAVEVTLPKNQPVRNPVLVMFPLPLPPGQGPPRLFYRHPLLIQSPMLHAGPIEAKVIHESGEIIIGAPAITLLPTSPPTQN